MSTGTIHPGCWRRGGGSLPGAVAALVCLVAMLAMVVGFTPSALAQPGMTTPPELVGIDPESRNGELVALDVVLMNDAGQMVRVGDYFADGPLARTADGRGKPAILAFVYYDCPIVCVLTMERLRQAMNKIEYIVGEDFNVLVVSIDHTNTTDMALEQKLASLLSYNKPRTPAVDAGWAYHTATAGNSRRLADSVGFKYNFIADAGEYAHAPGIILITPEGRIARYIDGVDFVANAGDIQLGLVEASQGQIAATLLDRLTLWCFHWDPNKDSYTLQAKRVMRIGGVLSMVGIFGLVLVLRGQEKRKVRKRAARAGREVPASAASEAAPLSQENSTGAQSGAAPRPASRSRVSLPESQFRRPDSKAST